MHDDIRSASRLLDWYASAQGACFSAAAQRLVTCSLQRWPALGRRLLEVNCAAGGLQRPLRRMGFDVTGCEGSPALRKHFADSLGSRFVVDPAKPDLLPYGDASFDWVLVHLEHGTDHTILAQTLSEARRVALQGLAVLVWNAHSLGNLGAQSVPLTAHPALSVYMKLGQWEGSRCCAGALFAPVRWWEPSRPAGRDRSDSVPCVVPSVVPSVVQSEITACLNQLREKVARCTPCALLGSVCLLRLELPPSCPLTARPLPFRKVRFAGGRLVGSCSDRVSERPNLRSGAPDHKAQIQDFS